MLNFCIHLWLFRVTLVVAISFLPQNFGAYNDTLSFCECRFSGGDGGTLKPYLMQKLRASSCHCSHPSHLAKFSLTSVIHKCSKFKNEQMLSSTLQSTTKSTAVSTTTTPKCNFARCNVFKHPRGR